MQRLPYTGGESVYLFLEFTIMNESTSIGLMVTWVTRLAICVVDGVVNLCYTEPDQQL